MFPIMKPPFDNFNQKTESTFSLGAGEEKRRRRQDRSFLNKKVHRERVESWPGRVGDTKLLDVTYVPMKRSI